jgi:NADH:ubiquinone oxidoreductase subunit 4 (subunit M)
LIFLSLFQSSTFLTFFSGLGIILSAAYSIWLFNRVVFGSLKLEYFNVFQDVSRREFFILGSIALPVLWIGVYPEVILNEFHISVFNLIEQLNYVKK